jgi:hypothetical protein
MKKSRIVILAISGGRSPRSRGRFATLADFPRHDGTPHRAPGSTRSAVPNPKRDWLVRCRGVD